MTLEQYWTILMKQWKFIFICFVVVGLGAFIGSKLMTPVYQSSTLVQIAIRSTNSQADYNSLLASDQLVQTESQLAVSDPVLREVASHYPGLTVEQLQKEVSSTTKVNTQLFELDVIDPSPTRAATLANDIAATLIKQQIQVIQQDNGQSQQQVKQDLATTRQQIDVITNQIAALQAKGRSQSQIAVLQAQLSGLQQHFSQWQSVLAQLELTEAQNGDIIRIAQPAQPGVKPVKPSILLNTSAGLLAGLLLGILLAVIFEKLDTRVRTPEAFSQLLDWPVLATLWRVNSSNREDVVNPTGQDANVESYRILRTNIGFSNVDKQLHTLMVTSAMPRDGKSVIAANVAIFMAKTGKKTLLIDADLRRPIQHTLFGISADKMGLSNAILANSMPGIPNNPTYQMEGMSNTPAFRMASVPNAPSFRQSLTSAGQGVDASTAKNVSLEPFVHTVGTPNLWVMPTGPLPPNPSELLDSKAMQRFLSVIANCGVEVVIFDSPPLLGISDTSILASKVDGVLVVVDAMRSTKGKLKQVKAVLAQAGAHVIGCVVNKQPHNRKDTAYSYYYYRTEEKNGDVKDARNGHTPTGLVTSSQPVSHFEQRNQSN
jgi:Mrp family chromosome partitioning ATPase/capsular polysaccharide biosynthesis protein